MGIPFIIKRIYCSTKKWKTEMQKNQR
uniref:Uncharacterized protein n=1 Tax=Heterorhabditis bacteriophora TaxID=37862 RepID=A0A1I7WAD4_HETBA